MTSKTSVPNNGPGVSYKTGRVFHETAANAMLPLNARLIERTELMADHAYFKFRLDDDRGAGPDGTNHRPGQFVMLTALGVGEAPISICHAPNGEKELHLTIRSVGRVTSELFQLPLGTLVGLRGPFGRGYPLENMEGHDLVMMAGGLGMAPLRSLLQYARLHRERFGAQVHLLYGAREQAQFLYMEELRAIEREGRISVHLACDVKPESSESVGIPVSQGNLNDLVGDLPFDPVHTRFAVCGPPVMYGYVTNRLRELNVPPGNIHVSLERRMECGIGKCGHCTIGYRYTCLDGPVFSVWEARGLHEAWQPPKGIDDPYMGGWR